jgi:hypothetical protein
MRAALTQITAGKLPIPSTPIFLAKSIMRANLADFDRGIDPIVENIAPIGRQN